MGKHCSLLLCSLRLYFEERYTCWCLYSQLFRMTVMSNNKSCDLSLILVDFFSKWVNRQTKNKLATVPDNLGRFSTNTINWRSYTSSADNITKVLIQLLFYLIIYICTSYLSSPLFFCGLLPFFAVFRFRENTYIVLMLLDVLRFESLILIETLILQSCSEA